MAGGDWSQVDTPYGSFDEDTREPEKMDELFRGLMERCRELDGTVELAEAIEEGERNVGGGCWTPPEAS